MPRKGAKLTKLYSVTIDNFTSQKGYNFPKITLSYEVFGSSKNWTDNRVVLINHALTGNSHVAGENGWWSSLLRDKGPIDLQHYTVICFNIPGNGYCDSDTPFPRHDLLTTRDVAALYGRAIAQLGIQKLYAVLGPSLGGLITWEMAIEVPQLAHHFIPIGAHYESTDWIKAHTAIQEEIVKMASTEEIGIKISRMLAMMFYRTSISFAKRFQGEFNKKKGMYQVESYLHYQGEKLLGRMRPSAYRMMNHLLGSGDLAMRDHSKTRVLNRIEAPIHMIAIDSDILFHLTELTEAYQRLQVLGKQVSLDVIKADTGHDTFLMENNEFASILMQFFSQESKPDKALTPCLPTEPKEVFS